MSSHLGLFKTYDEFLDSPMLIEFKVWIMGDIEWRLGFIKCSEDTINQIKKSLFYFLSSHTNREYLECADSLTSGLEKFFVEKGVPSHDAIRLSWKWSD